MQELLRVFRVNVFQMIEMQSIFSSCVLNARLFLLNVFQNAKVLRVFSVHMF